MTPKKHTVATTTTATTDTLPREGGGGDKTMKPQLYQESRSLFSVIKPALDEEGRWLPPSFGWWDDVLKNSNINLRVVGLRTQHLHELRRLVMRRYVDFSGIEDEPCAKYFDDDNITDYIKQREREIFAEWWDEQYTADHHKWAANPVVWLFDLVKLSEDDE
jgi:hypothetical protein